MISSPPMSTAWAVLQAINTAASDDNRNNEFVFELCIFFIISNSP
jgi:hypothetical protein